MTQRSVKVVRNPIGDFEKAIIDTRFYIDRLYGPIIEEPLDVLGIVIRDPQLLESPESAVEDTCRSLSTSEVSELDGLFLANFHITDQLLAQHALKRFTRVD